MKPETAFRIRAATAADLPAITALEQQADTAAHWSARQYRDALQAQPCHCFLLGGDLIAIQGFLVAREAAGEWEIENVVVAAGARRRGLASVLIITFIDWARGEGASAVSLEVRESNRAARALYEKLKFRENGRRKGYYVNPREDSILYWLALSPGDQ